MITEHLMIQIDEEANAAYVYVRPIAPGEAETQILVEDSRLTRGDVILDLNSEGRLLGIEILGYRSLLGDVIDFERPRQAVVPPEPATTALNRDSDTAEP